jgi:cytochrome c peroxidase
VFLIDPEFRIRNIYSVEFLHADLVINDIKTLIRQQNTAVPDSERTRRISYLSAPGDSKDGYESAAYQTQSRALDRRSQKGKSMDLLAIARNPPLGLPEIDAQQLKTLSPEKIDLGKLLFFDRRLSLNDTFSCAMCHVPEQGFTSNELSMAVGIEGRSVRRNTPTIFNVAYAKRLFHDGRENALDQQVWGPLLAKNEMGNPSIGYVVDKIRNIEGYEAMFTEAFKGRGIDMQTIGQALAAYQTTLVSADSDFDRWYFGKQPQALSEQARHGFRLFTGKANCSSCHVISTQSALFTDNLLHNTGIGYRESMGIRPDKERVLIAPGVYVDVERKMIEEVGHKPPPDLGLYEITENPHDRWKYKTPTLRNIALTAPYMHNGSIGTLREVVQFYNGGGVPNALLDTRIKPLDLTEGEIDSLVAFLESLTGSNVDLIVSDAFSVPVGDLQHSDPNWANVIGISNR